LGISLAITAAVLWAISPLCFASAARRVGSLRVNLMRILLAGIVLLTCLPLYYLLTPAVFVVPTMTQLGWLLASGLVGIAIGDLLMYESLVTLGPRRTTQLYTLQPVAAVAAGYLAGESLSWPTLVGIAIVIGATTTAIFARPDDDASKEPGKLTTLGLTYGISAAIFNGLGAVAGRQAFRHGPNLDPFLATTFRVTASAAIMWLLPLIRGTAGQTIGILRQPGVAPRLLSGTAVGPIIGMVCYVSALKQIPAGLVSTIVSTSPLLVLPYVTLRYRARLGFVTPAAAATACCGVALITNPDLLSRLLHRIGLV
jgi:drug/metabolite transporter (DMT)-like permease